MSNLSDYLVASPLETADTVLDPNGVIELMSTIQAGSKIPISRFFNIILEAHRYNGVIENMLSRLGCPHAALCDWHDIMLEYGLRMTGITNENRVREIVVHPGDRFVRISNYLSNKLGTAHGYRFRYSDFSRILVDQARITNEYDIVINESPAYFQRYKEPVRLNPLRLP